MITREDKYNKILKQGDIIDIHQTVNGQNKFIILSLFPLDIRYYNNVDRKYEYDKEELLNPDKYTGETTYEIVGSINEYY